MKGYWEFSVSKYSFKKNYYNIIKLDNKYINPGHSCAHSPGKSRIN